MTDRAFAEPTRYVETFALSALAVNAWSAVLPAPKFGGAGKILAGMIREAVGGNIDEIAVLIVNGNYAVDGTRPADEHIFAEWTGIALSASATLATQLDPLPTFATNYSVGRQAAKGVGIMFRPTSLTSGTEATADLVLALNLDIASGKGPKPRAA